MNPQQYCRRICKKSGSNFVYAFYLLPKRRRLAMEALYAFCRLADDAVDEAANPEQARENLKMWREEIGRMYDGSSKHPVGLALSPVVKEYGIPKKVLEEIVTGCEMDLEKKTYAAFHELDLYCYRVASCVGLASLHIFGADMTDSLIKGGIALGKALQLTNILRDIAGDLKRGRVYLPEEDMKRFGVSLDDVARPNRDNLNLVECLYFEIERARGFYKEAWDHFPTDKRERRKLIAAILMGKIYEAILNKIARDPMQVFARKVGITTTEKLKIALKTIVAGLL